MLLTWTGTVGERTLKLALCLRQLDKQVDGTRKSQCRNNGQSSRNCYSTTRCALR